MKLRRLLTTLSCALLALPLVIACDSTAGDGDGDGDGDCGPDDCGCVIEGTISEDVTWTCDKTLEGIVRVDEGVTLTIDPGVVISGNSGSALIVDHGRLEAAGTADAPIVFTSSLAEGSRKRGDWGGVVLLGNATTNLGATGLPEGLDGDYAYGGDDDSYNCGTLKYVRVEFAGFELTTDNELNGITFYACGTGTTVEYVQVHMGKDDGLEMFGGTFDAHHLIVTGAVDDSIDADQGYRGNLDYVFIQQDPSIGNYAFEISNQSDNLDAEPRTAPVINYATLIGSGNNDSKSSGVRFKEGAAGELHNSIITNFYKAQVDLTEVATEDQATAGNISITNNTFWNNGLADGELYATGDGSSFDLEGWVEDEANNNSQGIDPMLGSIAWGSPDIVPGGAVGAAGAVTDSSDDFTRGWTIYATE